MISPNTALKITYQDYRQTPDDERYELLDGTLIMVPAPRTSHQRALAELMMLLLPFVKARRLGEVFIAPFDVVLSNIDVVQPDILFISNERADMFLDEENLKGAPDLIVEILSPSTAELDKTIKRELYAKHGVKEYWLVDPDIKTVTLLLLSQQGRFETAQTYSEGQTLYSHTLKGFTFELNDIF